MSIELIYRDGDTILQARPVVTTPAPIVLFVHQGLAELAPLEWRVAV